MPSKKKETQRKKCRFFFYLWAVGAIFVFLLTLGGSLPAVSEEKGISFAMELNYGAYVINARIHVPAARAQVWEVLTDYGHLSDFVSSLAYSGIKESNKDFFLVEQRGRANFLAFFEFKIHALLKVTEEPLVRINFNDVLNENFEYYSGCWQIEDEDGGTSILYHLKAKPNFFAPDFIAGGVFSDNARSLLEQVKSEIIRRTEKKSKETITVTIGSK